MLKMVLISYTTASMFREAARPSLTKVNGTQDFGLSSVGLTQRVCTTPAERQLQAALVCALPASWIVLRCTNRCLLQPPQNDRQGKWSDC